MQFVAFRCRYLMNYSNFAPMKKRRLLKYILCAPAFLYSGALLLLILFLTLSPDITGGSTMKLFPHADKAVHFLMFGALAAALTFDIFRRRDSIRFGLVILCGIVSSLIGGLVEILQEAMRLGRSGDVWDFLADCCGAFVFALISGYICNKCLYISL